MKTTYFDYRIKGFVPFSGQTENGFAVVGRILDRDGNVIEQGYLFKAYTDEEREAFFAQNTGGGIGVGEDGYSPIWLEKQPPTDNELRMRRRPLLEAFDKWEKAVLRGRESEDEQIMSWYQDLLKLTPSAFENIPERVQYYLQSWTIM